MYGYEWEDLGENNASEDIFLIANKSTAYIFVGAKGLSPVATGRKSSKICEIVNNVTIQASSNTWEGRCHTSYGKDGLSNDFCDFFERECEETLFVIFMSMQDWLYKYYLVYIFLHSKPASKIEPCLISKLAFCHIHDHQVCNKRHQHIFIDTNNVFPR